MRGLKQEYDTSRVNIFSNVTTSRCNVQGGLGDKGATKMMNDHRTAAPRPTAARPTATDPAHKRKRVRTEREDPRRRGRTWPANGNLKQLTANPGQTRGAPLRVSPTVSRRGSQASRQASHDRSDPDARACGDRAATA
jgi:hypothetical protein